MSDGLVIYRVTSWWREMQAMGEKDTQRTHLSQIPWCPFQPLSATSVNANENQLTHTNLSIIGFHTNQSKDNQRFNGMLATLCVISLAVWKYGSEVRGCYFAIWHHRISHVKVDQTVRASRSVLVSCLFLKDLWLLFRCKRAFAYQQ